MPSVKDTVQAKIQGKKVMVFSKSYCPYCAKAKKVLEALKKSGQLKAEDVEVWEIENEKDCDAIQDALKSISKVRSVSHYRSACFRWCSWV